MSRWYQNIEGIEGIYEDPKRKYSKFWNEGKWDTFIKPLLPEHKRTFLEIGCNAGLFLKKAMDEGFVDVLGIESNKSRMVQAQFYREKNKCNYKLKKQTMNITFNFDELSLFDVVLISNMHYYLPIHVFSNLVDKIKSKAVYCIIVSAKASRRGGNAYHHFTTVNGYFRDWKLIKKIDNVEEGGDPAPRQQMYGVVYKSNLNSEIIEKMYKAFLIRSKSDEKLYLSNMSIFFKSIFDGQFNKKVFYDCWKDKLPENMIEQKMKNKKELAEDIQKNGIKCPIYINNKKNKILDGAHRLIIAKELGYKHITVRRI